MLRPFYFQGSKPRTGSIPHINRPRTWNMGWTVTPIY